MTTRAALIGLRVVLNHINHAHCDSPIGFPSVTGGGLSPLTSAQPFNAPCSFSFCAGRAAREASPPPNASRANPFDSFNHDAVYGEKAQHNHVC